MKEGNCATIVHRSFRGLYEYLPKHFGSLVEMVVAVFNEFHENHSTPAWRIHREVGGSLKEGNCATIVLLFSTASPAASKLAALQHNTHSTNRM